MHVAIPLDLTLRLTAAEPIITKGIATNISEGGMFVEYLDLDALKTIEQLESIKDVPAEVQIYPSTNFPEQYRLAGIVRRREFRKRGLGLAIEFS